jgi:hypothetical protein
MEKTRRQEARVREALAAIMEEYKPRSAQEAQTVLRDLFAGTLEDMVKAELDGHKDVLGFWIRETEGAKEWLNIFDGLKARGVKRVSFVSADGLKGVEDAARTAFGDGMTFQRCIVHLVRNSLKYVPSKHYKEFCADLKAAIFWRVNIRPCAHIDLNLSFLEGGTQFEVILTHHFYFRRCFY